MGGQNCIGISKANRAALGVEIGDTVIALIELDEAPREVELPPELKEALAADPQAGRSFEALAFTHRREYAQWVAEAKRPETRQRRVAETLRRVRSSQTRS
ncbi:MAG: YdeI/OmpD-associated family protein [Candidatus Nanopelagicales bacterium]